jgi:hypothetical protein
MLKNLSIRENPKWKEVKKMKKYAILLIFFMVLGVGNIIMQSEAGAAPVLTADVDNDLFFQNVEVIYRPSASCGVGECLAFNPANDPVGWQRVIPINSLGVGTGDRAQVADVIVGIINVQNIEAPSGVPTWSMNIASDQLSGYFAQRIAAITLNDPALGIEHLTLDSAIDPWGILPAGTMFALYVDDGAGFSAYETNGTILDDIGKAINGSLFGTLTEVGGYAYGHVDIDLALSNFSDQEAFVALNFIINNTGFGYLGLNDINENEVGGLFLLNDLIGTSELEVNPAYLTGGSPWPFRSNDPVTEHPVPEPSTMLLLGSGLLGLGFYARRKKK